CPQVLRNRAYRDWPLMSQKCQKDNPIGSPQGLSNQLIFHPRFAQSLEQMIIVGLILIPHRAPPLRLPVLQPAARENCHVTFSFVKENIQLGPCFVSTPSVSITGCQPSVNFRYWVVNLV